jgi:hypothetical protein
MDDSKHETNENQDLDQEGASLLLSVGQIMTAQDRHFDGLRTDDSSSDNPIHE